MKMQLPEGSLNCLLVTRLCVVSIRPIKVEYTIPTVFHASMVRSRQPQHSRALDVVFTQLGLKCIASGHGFGVGTSS